jgi:hypothetical protein
MMTRLVLTLVRSAFAEYYVHAGSQAGVPVEDSVLRVVCSLTKERTCHNRFSAWVASCPPSVLLNLAVLARGETLICKLSP